jgi:hypothetical protein
MLRSLYGVRKDKIMEKDSSNNFNSTYIVISGELPVAPVAPLWPPSWLAALDHGCTGAAASTSTGHAVINTSTSDHVPPVAGLPVGCASPLPPGAVGTEAYPPAARSPEAPGPIPSTTLPTSNSSGSEHQAKAAAKADAATGAGTGANTPPESSDPIWL